MSGNKILEVKNLKTHFKNGSGKRKLVVKAVDGISFDLFEGEVFGLVGESGCGKTTTGRTIIKLHEATDGEVTFRGNRIVGGYESLQNAVRDEKSRVREVLSARKAEVKEQINSFEDKKASENEIATLKSDLNDFIAARKQELADFVSVKKSEINSIKSDNAFKGETVGIMKNIQMIFQDPISSLNPRMTVREIIAEGLIIEGELNNKEIDEKVMNILRVVGLQPEHAFRYPHEFSGGQRQRIGIARALIVEPELLIADEPISALDVSIQAQVINLLKNLQAELGLTILFIAHDLSVVKYFSDRIAVMYFGKMVELATSDKLFANPLHPYTKSLLSAIPLPDPHYEQTRVRFNYVPQEVHNYGPGNMPSFVEVEEGHFVLASEEEAEKCRAEIKANSKK